MGAMVWIISANGPHSPMHTVSESNISYLMILPFPGRNQTLNF